MIFDIESASDRESIMEICGPRAVGLTSGCFDLFHYLHLIYLQKCRRLCEYLIVGVDSDRLVRETKGENRPVIPEQQRVALVAALDCVDAVFVMDGLHDFSRALGLGPVQVYKNDAFTGKGSPQVVGLRDTKAELVIIPDVCMPDSTSRIIEEILARKTQGDNHDASNT